MARSQELSRLFQHPQSTAQRHYEICRAYFFERLPAEEIARRFALQVNTVRTLVRDFAQNLQALAYDFLEAPDHVLGANPATNTSADERRTLRQQKSRPLADAFQKWLRTKLGLISQKGKLADAIRYALSRWDGVTRFIDDGRIELDNNTVERSIRPITLNRKNALFAGSDGGAEHWAIIASLIETVS